MSLSGWIMPPVCACNKAQKDRGVKMFQGWFRGLCCSLWGDNQVHPHWQWSLHSKGDPKCLHIKAIATRFLLCSGHLLAEWHHGTFIGYIVHRASILLLITKELWPFSI
jgi:hypothetical protein